MTAPLPDGYRFDSLDGARLRDVLTLDTWAFPTGDNLDDLPPEAMSLDWERTFGVVAPGARDGELAAMYSTYSFDFPVPGASLPTGGLTWVGVHPQHRRRGILKAMVGHHFGACAERGEVVSALTAAEYPIYGRFGYGVANEHVSLTLPRRAALRDVPGAADHTVRIEQANREAHEPLVQAVHQAAGRTPAGVDGLNRPGWVTRGSEDLWRSHWADLPMWRGGRESRRIVIVERDGEPRGYAELRRKLDWDDDRPAGTVSVGEHAAVDAAAHRALWGALLDLDLMSTVTVSSLTPDAPLLQLLVDRRAGKPRLGDHVWVRLLDVGATLAGRQYQADVDVVVGVRDAVLPANAGSWHLRATAFGEAACERTDAAPDLELDVAELAVAHSGRLSLGSLATAGLVVERTAGALARASAAFGWPVAPGTSWGF